MLPAYFKGFSIDVHTEAANTAIVDLIPPEINSIAKINALKYTSAGTAHTLTILKALGQTTTTAAAVVTATTLNVAALAFGAGQTLAANDYIAVQLASGKYFLTLVSNVATLALTITALPEAVVSGAKVFLFGAAGDTGHFVLSPPVSATTDYVAAAPAAVADSAYDFVSGGTRYSHSGVGLPMMVHSTNGTAAGTVHFVGGTYFRH